MILTITCDGLKISWEDASALWGQVCPNWY